MIIPDDQPDGPSKDKRSKRPASRRTRTAQATLTRATSVSESDSGDEPDTDKDDDFFPDASGRDEIDEDRTGSASNRPTRTSGALTSRSQTGKPTRGSQVTQKPSSREDDDTDSVSLEEVPSDREKQNGNEKECTKPDKRPREEDGDKEEQERSRKKHNTFRGPCAVTKAVPVGDDQNDLVTVRVLKSHISVLTETVGTLAASVRSLHEKVDNAFPQKSANNLTESKGEAVKEESEQQSRTRSVKEEQLNGVHLQGEDQVRKRTPKDAYQSLMLNLTSNIKIVFCKKVTEVCIAKASTVQMIRQVNAVNTKTLTPSGFLSAIRVSLTAPKRGKVDKALRTEVHAFFRRLVTTAIELARDNSLLLFRDGIPANVKKETPEGEGPDKKLLRVVTYNQSVKMVSKTAKRLSKLYSEVTMRLLKQQRRRKMLSWFMMILETYVHGGFYTRSRTTRKVALTSLKSTLMMHMRST